ncbi:MAG: hypothetical protein O7H41_04810 [Planctomycetota bacterium]|nr:hypothetical protein [Planctomycetota bacterium]
MKHTEMGWGGGGVGGGLKYHFLYGPPGNVYVSAQAGYTHWRGFEDDTITHPGFDLTLFKRDGPQEYEPRDLYGYEMAVGLGADWFSGNLIAVGGRLTYRYQDGTRGFTAHWIEMTYNATIRF